MKAIALILLLAASRTFAFDDTNLIAAGEWSKPVATQFGRAIRGRLLICDTPDHASFEQRTDTAVYLELQEFSSAIGSVRVYCGLNRFSKPDDATGLRCELRDHAGNLIPPSPGGFSAGEPGSCWVTLMPYCSARLRASVYGGGRLDDGGLAIRLCSSQERWDVHPNPTNDYYLSGTFTSPCLISTNVDPNTGFPLNVNSHSFISTNMDVWCGTLILPPVKIPIKKQ